MEQSSVAAVSSAVALPRKGGQVLLLSELFPPTVGGSAVLFHGIYSRLRDANVLVLTDGASTHRHGERQGELTVFRRPLATSRWGLFDPSALLHHFRIAFQLRMRTSRRSGVVHCARALPEGVAALLGRLVFTLGERVISHGPWQH